MTTKLNSPFAFNGPIDRRTGSGGCFQMTFPNGFTVSVANTTLTDSDVQRVEVAIMRDGKIINMGTLRDHDYVESFVTPERVLAIMLETALRTD